MRVSRAATAVLAAAIGLACMPEVVRSRTDFTPSAPGDDTRITIGAPVEVGGVTGFQETLEKGSTWKRVGSVEQGDVYKRTGGVFMLTGRNAHEAYLVVSGGQLVGFYLPGENAFAPASKAVALPPP